MRCSYLVMLSGLAAICAGCAVKPVATPPNIITMAPPATIMPPAPGQTTTVVKSVDVKTMCGRIKSYTAKDADALAAAVNQLDKDSPIITAMGDYKRMRDEARACRDFK